MRCKINRWRFVLMVSVIALIVGNVGYADAVKTIKIGAIGPMKFQLGKHVHMGAVLAVEEINNAGGIKIGNEIYKLDLVKIDDNSFLSVIDAVSAMERAITVNKVDFFVGGSRTEAMLAQQEILAENKIIFINSTSGGAALTGRIGKNYDKYKYFFRVGMMNGKYLAGVIFGNVEMIINKVRGELGIQSPKVAILAEKVEWPDAIIAAAKVMVPKMGAEIVGVWRPSATAKDTTAELTAITNAGAQIIFTVGGGPVDTVWSKQYGELQIPAAMVGIGTDAGRSDFWETSGGSCNYLLVTTPLAPVPGTKFYSKFEKRFGTTPIFPALSYDGLYILKDSLEKAGTLETNAVIAALEKTDYKSSRGRIVFNPKGHAFPHDYIWGPGFATGFGIQWQDGKQVIVWPAGEALMGNEKWKGIKIKNSGEFILPPRMIKYWKGKE